MVERTKRVCNGKCLSAALSRGEARKSVEFPLCVRLDRQTVQKAIGAERIFRREDSIILKQPIRRLTSDPMIKGVDVGSHLVVFLVE